MAKKTISIGRQELNSLLKGSLKTIYNSSGTIKYKEGKGRIVIIVGAKQEKRAVYRNKIKRRVRSLFLKESRPFDAIFYPSKKAILMEYQDFKVLFYGLIQKM